MSKRDLLSPDDLNDEELVNLLELAERMQRRGPRDLLKGRILGLLFRDPSLRTRVSFDVAISQLGGRAIALSSDDAYGVEAMPDAKMDGSAEEHVKDAALALSRYLDVLGLRESARGGSWKEDREDPLLRAYAEHASIPIINLQSHMHHPCQALADAMTMRSKVRELRGRRLTLAWTQDPQAQSVGVPHSLVLVATRLGMDLRIAHPQGFELDDEVLETARGHAARCGGTVEISHDLESACEGADFVYARSWRSIPSYDDPDRERLLKRSLDHWMLTPELIELGNPAWLMQPLPVRRKVSVASEVLDGPWSLIGEQAENRLHLQKALLVFLLGS
ncbi:MAG: acetylornithine carbamoyltransferase [Planctomycetota bacterium]|nr:MAG: acetylornithine carbamoyltransferase [Planctomycetota bacterium]